MWQAIAAYRALWLRQEQEELSASQWWAARRDRRAVHIPDAPFRQQIVQVTPLGGVDTGGCCPLRHESHAAATAAGRQACSHNKAAYFVQLAIVYR